MVQDASQDGMLRLLQGKPESCWRLNVRGAPQVLDFGPRDRAEPLEIHDRVVVTQCLLPVKHSIVFVEDYRTLSQKRATVATASLSVRTWGKS